MEERQGGNPTPDFTEGDAEFGSAENFFDALENEVNSAITESEEPKEAETSQKAQDPQEATPVLEKESTESPVDWEKRYKDSSREAQKLNSKLKEQE